MIIANIRGQSPTVWLANPLHVYVGRRVALGAGKNAGQAWMESPLGNPFKPGRDRDPMGSYEEWLREMLSGLTIGARKVQQAFAGLSADSVLGCWCAPGPCHAEVIVKVWEERRGT